MKTTIKHIIYDSLSAILSLSSIFIGLGLPALFGAVYRDAGDKQCIAYTILSIAVSILIYNIGIKLSTHKTREDKQRLYNRLDYRTDNDLAYLIETCNIEAIKERYEVKQYDL